MNQIQKNRIFRIVSLTILLSFLSTIVAPATFAEDKTGKIVLKKGFLKPLKFSQNKGEKHSVYGFSGLSFSSEFENVISEYPPALNEAKKSFVYNGFALIGMLGMTTISLLILLDTIDDAQKVSSGEMVDDSFSWSYIVWLGVCGFVMIISSIMGNTHLKRGVKMYNDDFASKSGTVSSIAESFRLYVNIEKLDDNVSPVMQIKSLSNTMFKVGLSFNF